MNMKEWYNQEALNQQAKIDQTRALRNKSKGTEKQRLTGKIEQLIIERDNYKGAAEQCQESEMTKTLGEKLDGFSKITQMLATSG